jgi:anti-sigma regulatory factor (Ser/Thr protein kinase)
VSEAGKQFHARIASDTAEVARFRKTFEAFVASQGFDAVSTGEIGLVVNEALANIIRHAYQDLPGQPIEIDACVEQGRLDVAVRDWGSGVVPRVIDESEKDPHTPGGLGLPCMKKMTDRLEFVPQPDGMLLKLSRARTRKPKDVKHA